MNHSNLATLRRLALSAVTLALGGAMAARADDSVRQPLAASTNALPAEVQPPAEPADPRLQPAVTAGEPGPLVPLQGLNAGWSQGRFVLQSSDGRYVLHPWFQIQARNATTWREGTSQNKPGDDLQNGFEIRRLKFGFDGNVITPDLAYMLQFAVDRKTGATQLEMAWARYHFAGTPISIRAGQFKEALDHEQLMTSKYFVAADRTLVDDLFIGGEGFVQGAGLIIDAGGPLRGEVDFTDGIRNFNNNFQDYPTPGITADWGANGRVEYKLFGGWADYDHFAALNTRKPLLVAGAGADYTEAGHTGSLVHVADIQFLSPGGLGLYGAYLGRYTRSANTGKSAGDIYDWTVRTQASYTIGARWEPFVQYEYIHFDSRASGAGVKNEIHAIRAGVSYYLFGHNAKFTVDATYLPDGSPVADDGNGVLLNNGRREIVGRAQFQLLL